MSKLKKVFAALLGSLMVACSGLGTIGVKADGAEATSEFDDWEYFYDMNKPILYHHAHPKKLMRLPLFRQSTSYGCGVACTLSILRYFKYDFDIQQDDLATALGSNEDEGTKADNMVGYLNEVRYSNEEIPRFNAEFRQGMTIDDLKREIDNGHPVICAIQAWYYDEETWEYPLDYENYANEWECGHWAIAIGYNRDNIFFMDPSTAGNYTYISNDRMMERWHDYEGAVLQDESKVVQAGIVVKMNGNETPDCERYNDAYYKLG